MDDNFLKAFGDVSDNIKLPYEDAFKVYIIGNEMGLAFQELEKKRIEILEKHAVKNSRGKLKHDPQGGFVFKDKRAAEEELMVEFNKDIELNCNKLSMDIFERGVIPPRLIETLALINPIIEKEDEKN